MPFTSRTRAPKTLPGEERDQMFKHSRKSNNHFKNMKTKVTEATRKLFGRSHQQQPSAGGVNQQHAQETSRAPHGRRDSRRDFFGRRRDNKCAPADEAMIIDLTVEAPIMIEFAEAMDVDTADQDVIMKSPVIAVPPFTFTEDAVMSSPVVPEEDEKMVLEYPPGLFSTMHVHTPAIAQHDVSMVLDSGHINYRSLSAFVAAQLEDTDMIPELTSPAPVSEYRNVVLIPDVEDESVQDTDDEDLEGTESTASMTDDHPRTVDDLTALFTSMTINEAEHEPIQVEEPIQFMQDEDNSAVTVDASMSPVLEFRPAPRSRYFRILRDNQTTPCPTRAGRNRALVYAPQETLPVENVPEADDTPRAARTGANPYDLSVHRRRMARFQDNGDAENSPLDISQILTQVERDASLSAPSSLDSRDSELESPSHTPAGPVPEHIANAFIYDVLRPLIEEEEEESFFEDSDSEAAASIPVCDDVAHAFILDVLGPLIFQTPLLDT
ncbi:hypothetical protein BXZ70DRAFT_1069012 [Cristinia sonorae]|uniref:Uncharacterized protein n=1 Tax=Cristinia sonorae TaxID=1940300 RepID=A0A8K0XJI6_9AGAR|nr:hypothetical protein BXZ70DRAFT_1069012 [Cristinia sonorae]